MKYIKIFEDFEDRLFSVMNHGDYSDFSDRRNKMKIDEDVPKILKMIKFIFGNIESFTLDGHSYKEYEIYDDYDFAYFRFPYDDGEMIPPGINIVKYDDNWYLATYFPPKPTDMYSDDRKPDISYKVDTIKGLKELLIDIKKDLS